MSPDFFAPGWLQIKSQRLPDRRFEHLLSKRALVPTPPAATRLLCRLHGGGSRPAGRLTSRFDILPRPDALGTGGAERRASDALCFFGGRALSTAGLTNNSAMPSRHELAVRRTADSSGTLAGDAARRFAGRCAGR